MPVKFFTERITFQFPGKRRAADWIEEVAKGEGYVAGEINFIFCSDPYLLSLNKRYLNHDFYTDILTFDLGETEGRVEGDIFISLARVRENAKRLGIEFQQELHRVMVHGILHLMGYKDKKPADQAKMRGKEDAYLSLR
jgi:probable rRNA maturation factor